MDDLKKESYETDHSVDQDPFEGTVSDDTSLKKIKFPSFLSTSDQPEFSKKNREVGKEENMFLSSHVSSPSLSSFSEGDPTHTERENLSSEISSGMEANSLSNFSQPNGILLREEDVFPTPQTEEANQLSDQSFSLESHSTLSHQSDKADLEANPFEETSIFSAPTPPSFVNREEAQREEPDLSNKTMVEPEPFEETSIFSAPIPPSFINREDTQKEEPDLSDKTMAESEPFEETSIFSAPTPPSFVNREDTQKEEPNLSDKTIEEPNPFEEAGIFSTPTPPSFVNREEAQEGKEQFKGSNPESSKETDTQEFLNGNTEDSDQPSSSQEASAKEVEQTDELSENKPKKTFFASIFSGKDKKETSSEINISNQKDADLGSMGETEKEENSKLQSSSQFSLSDSNSQSKGETSQEGGTQSTQSMEVVSQSNQSLEQSVSPAISSPTSSSQQPQQPNYSSPNFLKELFANGNECITAPSGSFPVKEDTRLLLALFSNGRFFVSETYKFDGKVLGFEYLAKKRRLQIGKPEYIPMVVLSNIYEYASNIRSSYVEQNEEDQEQARMQRDFVTIISRAAASKVSDIHIVVADHTTVMFRINGLMQTEMEYNKEWGESFVRAAFASSDISDSNYAQNEYQAAQKLGRTPLRGSHGKLVLPHNVLGIRLQFNPIAFGSRYVIMRLLYASDDVASAGDVEALGFTKKQAETFYRLRGIPTGMIVISGPTGSGKSTTLQRNMIAMLQERNYEINLITVEDPPEYPIPGARQMPVTNASIEEAKDREFTRALSAALRSDPDSLMIGEIRTLSAADLAFRGALSGHNVWTTLHANSAPAVLMRLKDMGVEDFKLQDPEIMKGMLAQRLFRKVCPYCRVPASTRLDHPAVQRLREAFGDIGLEYAYLRGPGCKHCDFRGVSGRTVVAEFITPDGTFLDLMLRGESKKALNYWINDLNGQTLREAAQERMLEGIIDIEEVERWTGFLNQIIV